MVSRASTDGKSDGSDERAGRAVALTFALAFVYAALWTPQGLDFSDDGFHLANQQWLLHTGGIPRGGWGVLVWLSDLTGAAWLLVSGNTGLLAARLGWALMTAASAALAARILARAYPPRQVALAVLLATPMLLAQGRALIDYNGVAPLFMLLALDALTAREASPRREVLGGFSLGLATLARLPGLPVGLLVLAYMFVRHSRRSPAAGRRVLAGFVAVPVSIAAWVTLAGRAAALMASAASGDAGDTHGLALVARITGRDAVAVALIALLGLALLRGLLSIEAPRWLTSAGPLRAGACLMVAGLALAAWGAAGHARTPMRWSALLAGACLALLVQRILARASADELEDRRTEHLVLGLLVAVHGVLGSNTGLAKMTHGLWLAVPAAILATARLMRDPRTGPAPGALVLGRGLVVGLALAGVILRFGSPYRDGPDRLRLVRAIDDGRLAGIRTSAARAAAVGALLQQARLRVREGDALLAYGDIPLLHFLTQTDPALGHVWPELLGDAELARRLEALGREGRLPVIAVHARLERLGAAGTMPPGSPGKQRLIDGWLRAQGYASVWANDVFEILAR
jgi:hypothetical protein